MAQEFGIPCELTIIPGGASRQNKIILRANGETVFDDYEDNLSDGQKEVTKLIAQAHARLLTNWSERFSQRKPD